MTSLPHQIATIARRLWHDPRLLPEVLRKLRSRFTLERHRRRLAEIVAAAEPPLDALETLLNIDRQRLEELWREPALERRLHQLEAWLDAPDPTGASRASGAAFLEVLYVVTRHLRPEVVVETGVSRGFSSTVLLQALEINGTGQLYGTNLPAFRPGEEDTTGSAVPGDLAASDRWHREIGPDRRVLPPLLEEIGPVDLFHYDSDKSYEGMRWTLEHAWAYLRPGAVLIFDDADSNDAFVEFAEGLGLKPRFVAKPTRRSVYRWSKKYYVGLLRKPS